MTIFNIHETKTHLSQIIERALKGEEIIIAKAGKPIACLTPYQEKPKKFKREGGQLKGIIKIADDFDAPMGEFEDEFYK